MRYLLLFASLCVIGGLCNTGCKKEERVVVKNDTLIVRDTIYRTLIRTDSFTGFGQLDCIDGCPYPPDYSALTDVDYYSNDSTNFRISISAAVMPGASSRQVFNFSIVKGKFSSWGDKVHQYNIDGPDSLSFYGNELPTRGPGTYTFLFRGKRS